MKKLLLGDEAIAQGAIDAGLSGVYAYPGTPSTEITEYIQESPIAKERNIHRRWSTNEKTAMEAALGMSYMGKRALVCMKHVGLNVMAEFTKGSAQTFSPTCFIHTSARLPIYDIPSAASMAVFSFVDQRLWTPRSLASGDSWIYSVISVEGVPG